MAEERKAAQVSAAIPPNPPVVDAALDRAQLKKKLITVLERGIVDDRLKVDLPPHLYGQWVRNDQFSIDRLKALGFQLDNEYAPQRSLHSDGTGRAQVADVVFMTCPMAVKEVLDEIRQEQFIATHGKPGQNKPTKEETDYVNAVREETGGVVPTLVESQTRELQKSELAATLAKLDSQGR